MVIERASLCEHLPLPLGLSPQTVRLQAVDQSVYNGDAAHTALMRRLCNLAATLPSTAPTGGGLALIDQCFAVRDSFRQDEDEQFSTQSDTEENDDSSESDQFISLDSEFIAYRKRSFSLYCNPNRKAFHFDFVFSAAKNAPSKLPRGVSARFVSGVRPAALSKNFDISIHYVGPTSSERKKKTDASLCWFLFASWFRLESIRCCWLSRQRHIFWCYLTFSVASSRAVGQWGARFCCQTVWSRRISARLAAEHGGAGRPGLCARDADSTGNTNVCDHATRSVAVGWRHYGAQFVGGFAKVIFLKIQFDFVWCGANADIPTRARHRFERAMLITKVNRQLVPRCCPTENKNLNWKFTK